MTETLRNIIDRQKVELHIQPSLRQQRKIIKAFEMILNGQTPDHALGVPDIDVSDDERNKILCALAGGAINNTEINQLLGRIRSENLDPVFIESLRDPAKTVDISAIKSAFLELWEKVIKNPVLVDFIEFINKKEHERTLERYKKIDQRIKNERESNIEGQYTTIAVEGRTDLENDLDLDIFINRHPNPYTIIRMGWINEYLSAVDATDEMAKHLFDGLRLLYGKKLEYANNIVELKKQSDIDYPEFITFRKNKLPGIHSIIHHAHDKISEDIKNGSSYTDAHSKAREKYLICREILYESLYEIYRARCRKLNIEPWNMPGLKMIKHEKIWRDILRATPRDQINRLIKSTYPVHNTGNTKERTDDELLEFEAKMDAWASATYATKRSV